MGLSREQYDRIMQVYQDRRMASLHAQEARRSEAFAAVPELADAEAELTKQAVELARAKLAGDQKRMTELTASRKLLLVKKARLLSRGGYAPDYLEQKPVCSRCGDTGYVDGVPCSCLKKLESQLIYADSGLPVVLSRENFQRFDLSVFDNEQILEELKPRYRVTQRMYMQSQVLPLAQRFAAEFAQKPGQNLLLTGPTGVGKTFLTNCIAKAVIDDCHTVLYRNAGDLFDALSRESFGRDTEGQQGPGMQEMLSCELLIIDDLGTELGSNFTNSRLFMIISHRLLQRLSTIISSNLSLNQLSRVYGDRVVSRLMEGYLKIPFYGRDLRLTARVVRRDR